MGGSELKLSVVLAAIDKATGPFKRIMSGSKGVSSALRQSQSALKKLNETQRNMEGFRQLESELGSTSNALQVARRKLNALSIEVNQAESPSKKLVQQLKRQGAEVGKLIQMEGRHRTALSASKQVLEAAGFNTQKLAAHERKLGADIASTTAKIAAQKTQLWKLHEAQDKAAKMQRGGMAAAGYGAAALYGGSRLMSAGAGSLQPGMDFETSMRDIGITGGFSRAEESALAMQVRADAKRYGQFTDTISQGLQGLVANGITEKSRLDFYSGLLAKTSVATGAEMGDLSNLAVTLNKNLGIADSGMKASLDSLAYAGKQGSFELRDMAKWMPQLTPQMAALGVTGKKAVDELGAALQVARMGAGSSDEAANNLRNFLSKIVAPDTIKNFADVGIDLKNSLMKLRSQGVSPLQGSLKLITRYMEKKGPEAARKFQAAISLKDEEQRRNALEQLSQAYALGDLFRDAQAMAFIRPALANTDKMQQIQQGASTATGGIDKDWAARMQTGQKQLDRFKIGMNDLKLTAYAALGPALNDLAGKATLVLDRVAAFAQRNPALTATLLKVAAAGGAVVTVFGGLLLTGGTAAMALSQIVKVSALLSGGSGLGSLVTKAMALGGRAFPMLATGARMLLPILGGISATLLLIGAAIAAVAVLVWKYWGPIKAFMIGVWQGIVAALSPAIAEIQSALAPLAPVWDMISQALGKALTWIKQFLTPLNATSAQLQTATSYGRAFGMAISTNLQIVGKVIKWVAGLVVWMVGKFMQAQTAVVGAWNLIAGIFTGDGGRIRAGLTQMWNGISTVLGGWPAKFLQFGINMVQGLVNGITGMAGAVKNAVVGAVGGAVDRFKNFLGIRSPSRLFAQFGDYTMQGFAGGLDRSRQLPVQAVLGMGNRLRQAGAGIALGAAASSAMAIDNRPPISAGVNGVGGGSMTVNITINAPSGSSAVDIAAAVRTELERIERDRQARTRSRLGDYD